MFFFRSALAFVCVVPSLIFAADPPTIKIVNTVPTSPTSGSEMFKAYCASCHGVDAKGHGPATPALKVPSPDLTLLSRNNHGKFPDVRVYSAIRGDDRVNAHGATQMPVWGTLLRDKATDRDNDLQLAMRVSNLCRYIQSLQQK